MEKTSISKKIRLQLPVTQYQLAALHLALITIAETGLSDSDDNFPSRSDLACLKQLDQHVWDLLTVGSRETREQEAARRSHG